jgi:hypothetical protein
MVPVDRNDTDAAQIATNTDCIRMIFSFVRGSLRRGGGTRLPWWMAGGM